MKRYRMDNGGTILVVVASLVALAVVGVLIYHFVIKKNPSNNGGSNNGGSNNGGTPSGNKPAPPLDACLDIKDNTFQFCNPNDLENSCYCTPCAKYNKDKTKCLVQSSGDCAIGLGEGESCPAKYLIRPYCREVPNEPMCAFMAGLETNGLLDTNCTMADDFHGCVSAHAATLWSLIQSQGRVDLIPDFYEALDVDSCSPNRKTIQCIKKDIENKYKKMFQ